MPETPVDATDDSADVATDTPDAPAAPGLDTAAPAQAPVDAPDGAWPAAAAAHRGTGSPFRGEASTAARQQAAARARAFDCGSCGRPMPRVDNNWALPDWLTSIGDEDEDSDFEWHLHVTLTDVVAADRNPHLTRDTRGRVWFLPGVVSPPGIGTLLPEQVNAILADPDTTVRLARAHPDTGAVDTLDEHVYRPGAALARLVRARDGTCRFPGCTTPAARCHLDHVLRYPDGPTSQDNLQTLCGVHHGFKHHANWSVTMTPEGICTWTAPTGRTHTTHPHAIHDHAA